MERNQRTPDNSLGEDIPALTKAQMAEVDRIMIETYGIQLIQMMENAGRSLAELARRKLGGQVGGKKIMVLCGAGNNGGGGMVAARHLANWGAKVQVELAASLENLRQLPADQWNILQAMGIVKKAALEAKNRASSPRDLAPDFERPDLILDALIGYGLSGNPRGASAEWIEWMNQTGSLIISLDIPSGLEATSGSPGKPCTRATATMTLALPKTGLLSPSASRYVGDLYLADIGVPPELYKQMSLVIPPLFVQDTIQYIPQKAKKNLSG